MLEILLIIFRVFVSYFVIFVAFRLMGKREVGELSLIDLIVFLLITEIVSLSIEALDKPYYQFLLAIGVLLFLQRGVAYLISKRVDIRSKIEGVPTVIIANGKVNYLAMRHNRLNFEDLLMQVRAKGYRSLSEVDFAILEANGTFSVFGQSNEPFVSPLPLILSGELLKDNFKYADIDEMDFKTLLRNKGYHDIKHILYANYENNELYIIALERETD